MVITRYKPFFSFKASYELADIGVSGDGISIEATGYSLETLNDRRLKLQSKSNLATVYFEGRETPVNAPVTCEPSVVINAGEYFYLLLNLSDKEKIKGLKIHSSDQAAKDTGYPVLYDALIPAPAAPAAVSVRDDVKVITPVFTFIATQVQSGITSAYATLEVRDENNNLVITNILPAVLNDKSIDGITAVPEYAFSVDVSKLVPGIYSFSVGAYQRKYFLARNMDITNAMLLIRILKNDFLEYKTSLADNSFARFELLIPKA